MYRLLSCTLCTAMLLFLTGCPSQSSDAPWRSALYPENWTPAFTDADGRFLHDFSYAGYGLGEVDLPATLAEPIIDVVAMHGADATGNADATAAIQGAIDAAADAGGGTVFFPAGLYRCDGQLTITESNIVLAGEGSTASKLYFTQVTGMTGKAHITFRGQVYQRVDVPLIVDAENRSFVILVAQHCRLIPGDEVALGWVITDDFIDEHNMTDTWYSFNGQWKPFFRRTVVAVDTFLDYDIITLDVPLRYPAKLRDSASLRMETGHLEQCGMRDLGIATAVEYRAAWTELRTHAITFSNVKDCWLRGVSSFASPISQPAGGHLQNGGIKVVDAKRMSIVECRMEKAQNRGGGGCGYLFEVSRSNEILFQDCTGLDGRHNFIQNWDFGTSGCVWLRCWSAGSRNMIANWDPIGLPAYSEFHHSLAMANLIDQCTLDDGWSAANRHDWSSGAGITSTENVFWNCDGQGKLRSWQYGHGYIIGTERLSITTGIFFHNAEGTAPEDYVEGAGRGSGLLTSSLYEDQRLRRLTP